MCVCVDETVDFWIETRRRARVEHRCEECREPIAPGAYYMRVATGYDGSVSSHAVCLGCRAWTAAYNDAARRFCGCSGIWIGQLWNHIAELAREHLGMPDIVGEVAW